MQLCELKNVSIFSNFHHRNTRIHNLISVRQVMRFLLEVAIILSKTNPCMAARIKRLEVMAKLEKIKQSQ